MASVSLPESLARLFPEMPRRLDVPGGSVGEVFMEIDGRYRGFFDRVCETRTKLRRHVLVFVDGEIASVDTAVSPGGDVLVVPALSGG